MPFKETLKENKAIILILAIFFTINILNISDYGITWDEPFQRQIGSANLDYLFGNSTSVASELQKGGFLEYGPFYEIGNYVIAESAIKLTNLEPIPAYHILGVIVGTIGLLFIFLFAKKLFNKKIAIYSTLIFCLFPQFIAHMHYNPKDIPIMIFSLIGLYFLYSAFQEKNYIKAIIAGIVIGFNIAIRIDSAIAIIIFIVPYAIYSICYKRILEKDYYKKELKLFVLFFLVVGITMFITWPTLWEDPLLPFKVFGHFQVSPYIGETLYFGTIYKTLDIPWHYTAISFIIITPIITLLCLLIGIIITLKKIKIREKILENYLLLTWLFLPIIIATLLKSVTYDGMRHSFIILPAIAIISALGFDFIIKKIESRFERYLPNISTIILLLFVLLMLIQIYEAHPYEGSYYNEVVRIIIPEHIEDYFEIEYWGSTYQEGIQWLNNNTQQNAIVCVPLAEHLVYHYKIRSDIRFGCNIQTNYLMFFTRNTPKIKDYQQVFSIKRYNSDLLYIYKVR